MTSTLPPIVSIVSAWFNRALVASFWMETGETLEKSLYEKYGGFGKINRVVMDFYDSLLDSDEIGPYFDEVDMRKLIDHQTKFVSSLLGGPAEFADDHLQRAHASLGVTDPHFDEMKAVLGGTLRKHNFDSMDIENVLAAIEARRAIIVT